MWNGDFTPPVKTKKAHLSVCLLNLTRDRRRRLLFADHNHGQSHIHITMQVQGDFKLTGGAESTFQQTNFTLLDCNTGLSGNRFGDLSGTNGTEQLAFSTDLAGDSD